MMCIDSSLMICVGATTEVEALKKALAEAEEKAAMETDTQGPEQTGARPDGKEIWLGSSSLVRLE